MTIAPVSHSPLTTSDITRLPSSAMINQPSVAPEMAPDQFVKPEKKTSFLKKVVWTAIGVAAAAVAIKKFKPQWLQTVADNPKWTDHIKNATTKIANWAEWPFKKVMSWFPKKAA